MNSAIALPIDLATPEQLSAVIFELQMHIGALRDAAARSKNHPQNAGEPRPHSALLDALLQACHVQSDDIAALEQLAKSGGDLLANAPTAHVILAALPTRDLRQQLTLWFRTEINPLVLLAFTARPDIGGGVIVRAGSRVYDYSFRRHILSNKKRIAELAFGV